MQWADSEDFHQTKFVLHGRELSHRSNTHTRTARHTLLSFFHQFVAVAGRLSTVPHVSRSPAKSVVQPCAHCNNCKPLRYAQLSSQYSHVSVFLAFAPFGNASNCRPLRQHDAAFTCADLIRVMSPNESCPYRTLAFCLRLDLWLRNQMWNTPRMVGPVDLYSSKSGSLLLANASDATDDGTIP